MKKYWKEELEKIILEQYPDNVFKKFSDRLGDAYGRKQTVNRLGEFISNLLDKQKEEDAQIEGGKYGK